MLVPQDISSTKSGIREFFRRIHLPPAGYQVGNTMVRTPQNRLCFCNVVFESLATTFSVALQCRSPFLCDVGVPAGGGASASADAPPPGSTAEDCHAAAALQSRSGAEALRQHATSRLHRPGRNYFAPQSLFMTSLQMEERHMFRVLST